MALSGGKKTQLNTLETDLNTAIAGLDPRDPANQNTLATLRRMRKLFELIKVERSQ